MINGDNQPARILVVDDIPDTLELLSNWLEVQGFKTIQARNGQQALDMATVHKPDLILLDVMMPKMDGIETCRQLKTRPQTANIPVILVTAKDPSDARADGMMAGAVDYITKPINLQDLTNRVEAALSTDFAAPVDVQRLLSEVAHTALAVLGSAMVWLLGIDDSDHVLASQTLATNSGTHEEANFLLKAGDNQAQPRFSLNDEANPMCACLLSRKTTVNLSTKRLQDLPSTRTLFAATEQLHINYLTVVPLVTAGKAVGVMALGSYQQQDLDSPRAQQLLSSFASQAAIALDYSRLSGDLSRRESEKRSEQTFRQMILDTMSDALMVIDAAGIVRYVNRRMLRTSGYPESELVGRSVGTLFHADDREEIMIGLLRENAATMKFDQRLLTQDGRIIPVLMSRSRSQSNQFDNQVIVLSDMTLQKERQEALERQSRRLMALNKAAQAIASNLSLHETLQDILDSATNVVEAQGASLFLVNRDNDNELVVVAAVGYRAGDLIGLRVPFGEGLAGWVARESQSQLVDDLDTDPRFYRQVDEQTGMNTRSLIAVPLIQGEQMIGVIEVVNKLNDGVFDLDDMRLLESMAGTAAVSIINARLFDESQRRVIELGTLLDASEAASSTLDFANVLQHIGRSLSDSLDVARVLVMAWNDFKNRLESLADVGDVYWAGSDGPTRALEVDSVLQAALTSGQPVMRSLQDANLSMQDRVDLESSGMVSVMALPIRLRDAVVGLAVLHALDGQYQDSQAAAAVIHTLEESTPDAETLADIDPDTLLAAAEALLKIGQTVWVTIHMTNPQAAYTRLIYEGGFAEWTRRSGAYLPLDDYPALQQVIHEKNHHLMTMSTQVEAERRWLEVRGGQVCLVVPLISHGAATGTVMLIDIHERIFDSQEIDLAQGIANVVSNAMENARLFRSLESRAKALESAYAELQAADKAKDEFIQNVSHELRTPLIHVLGYADLLIDGTFGAINDEQRDTLRTIAEKGQRVADIVQDMVSAQAQETRFYDRKPLDMIAIIQQILGMYKKTLQTAGLQVVTHFPPSVPLVLADAQLIAEALEKLLDNAIKFGTDGKRIEILVRDPDPNGALIQIAIRDFGIGIDPSEHDKIFQRFYQVDGGVARRYGGTGLGLSVAKAIIEGHSGRIGVKSKRNEGSIFYFTLPKADIVPS
jgi:PAS domain S-box-containing protein